MSYKLSLLIRKVDYVVNPRHPTAFLLANAWLYSDYVDSPTAYIDIKKGLGNAAQIMTTEDAFPKPFLISI